jgi:hypothetical protein
LNNSNYVQDNIQIRQERGKSIISADYKEPIIMNDDKHTFNDHDHVYIFAFDFRIWLSQQKSVCNFYKFQVFLNLLFRNVSK